MDLELIFNGGMSVESILIILVIAGVIAFYILLINLDQKKKYNFESIEKYLIQEEPLKLCVPYYIWQMHKRAVIIYNTQDTVTIGNRRYVVTSCLAEEQHVRRINDLLPAIFYRDVILTLKYIDEHESQRTTINILGDVNRVQIVEKTVIKNLEEIVAHEGYDDDIRRQLTALNEEIKNCGVNKENSKKTMHLLEKINNVEPIMSIISSTISILSSFI